MSAHCGIDRSLHLAFCAMESGHDMADDEAVCPPHHVVHVLKQVVSKTMKINKCKHTLYTHPVT